MQGPALQLDPACPKGITLAQCRLDADYDIALAEATALLSPSETARAARFHFDRDRNRYVRGRGFLRHTLGQALGQPAAGLDLTEGPQGKPVLAGHDLAFNLSHSRGLAVLALSARGPIGLDVEFIDRKLDIAGLAQSCFDADEVAVLDRLPAAARQTRFFAFWTAKEARMKLTGEGMSLPPKAISLILQDGWPVGYSRPDHATTVGVVFLETGRTDVLCCLAFLNNFRAPERFSTRHSLYGLFPTSDKVLGRQPV